MTREELRQKLIAGADKLYHSAAWRFLTDEEKMLSRCGREFWATDSPATNAALDAVLSLINAYNG